MRQAKGGSASSAKRKRRLEVQPFALIRREERHGLNRARKMNLIAIIKQLSPKSMERAVFASELTGDIPYVICAQACLLYDDVFCFSQASTCCAQ